jgi:hypothetical protein
MQAMWQYEGGSTAVLVHVRVILTRNVWDDTKRQCGSGSLVVLKSVVVVAIVYWLYTVPQYNALVSCAVSD